MPGYLRPDPETTLNSGYFDPVNKFRTSQAQALIDTDFEYSMQLSKWENLGLVNNRPFAYQSSNVIPNISAITLPQNSNKVTVTTSTNHGLVVGSAITVQDTFLSISDGNFIIEATTNLTFTYTARSINKSSTITSVLDVNKTALYVGTPYTSSVIGEAPSLSYTGKAISVTTTVPHGLALGNEFAISGITSTTNAPNGSWFVSRIINAITFIYYADEIPTGTLVATNAVVNVRPQAQYLHRPFDGGVLFSANASSNNQQAIRQTRRYFRYQSGKGMQISSGTVLKPNLPIEAMTASGTLVTVQTKEQHNLQPGSSVTIFGVNEQEYNGTYEVIEITGYNTFQYQASSAPFESKASGEYYATVQSWYGCTNRLGMFDSQNGMFFEFDGQTLYAVKRNSTYQLSGKLTVENGSNLVVQTSPSFPTNLSNQLEPGDFIVVRGQSYRVETIGSDTSMTITPSYRGADAQFVLFSKTIDTKIPQSEWSLDTMDGNGPSGYDIDLTKMQMFYIDYSWYGAGFVRFGLRGVDGEVTYAHKIVNNNSNSEAFMRSGNLPARYESNTFQKTTKITEDVLITDSELKVSSTEGFSPSGTLLIRGGTAYEYVNYASKSPTSFLQLTRADQGSTIDITIPAGSNIGTVASITGIQVGQRVISPNFPQNTYVAEISGSSVKFNTAAITADPVDAVFVPMASTTALAFDYSPSQPVSVEQAFPTYSASISHWGTSVIMDGKYDDDKSLLFTFGQTEQTEIPAAKTLSRTVTGTSGNYEIVVNDASDVVSGMIVSGTGLQGNTTVVRVNGTTLDISLPVTQSLTASAATFSGGNSRALFSIRVSPSVDNGIAANFGKRELINRMQLQLDSIGVTTVTGDASLLVTAILNGVPSSVTEWKNVVLNSTVVTNSSLSQIADYAELNTFILGGETTGGFYTQGTASIDLRDVRELGNSILGGGETFANDNVFPDGPDVLSIVVTNIGASPVNVLGRLGWSEAQA
jgi:hypothetical protein